MKCFISFLGTGNYQPCRYRHNSELSPEVTYVQTATCFFTHCDRAMVFCTVGAKSKHETGLVNEFKRHRLPDAKIVDIPDGASEEQLWEIFRIVRDAIAEGDEIVFDVTHSFRSLPVIMTVLLRYLAVAKEVVLNACLYGAWEARDGDNAPIAPIFDLTPFFALDDWTLAIRNFELFGDASELKNLSTRRLAPLCQNDDTSRSLNSAIRMMTHFADNVRLANLGADSKSKGSGIRSMALNKHIAFPLANNEIVDGIPELSPILNRVGKHFSDYGDKDVMNGFRAARWAAAHGLIPQAYTLLQETTISVVCERFRELIPETRTGIEVRSFVSDVLAVASNRDRGWDKWKPREEAKDAKNLADKLGEEILAVFPNLVRRRNALNHAGTNAQEPVSPTSPDYAEKGFLDIADAIEHTLGIE